MEHTHETTEPTAITKGYVIRWATLYDPVVRLMTLGQAARLRQQTVTLAAIERGNQVLDVGCGTGDLTLAAAAQVGSAGLVAGIDPAAEMIRVARKKAADKQINIDLRVGVIESLPFADGTFDVVLSSLMMHHLPDELQVRGLAEIYRVLRPGGRLMIVDFKGPTSSFGRAVLTLMLHGHQQHGIQDLRSLVERAGFAQNQLGNMPIPLMGYLCAHKEAVYDA